ncbi:hypothetical protein NCS52_01539100 [Fusarium sp. LHS14.1]|nr:hypothetical protein NCS52_01539100 [Fusarium sp. LHS14.1]
MAPPSSENTKFAKAITNVAAIAFPDESGLSIEVTDANDDENNDDKVISKITVVSLQSSGTSELLRVEADDEIGGLFRVGVKICDVAIKGRPRSLLSEEDISTCTESALLRTGQFSIGYQRAESLSTTYASVAVNEAENNTKTNTENKPKILAAAKGENNEKASFALLKVVFEKGLSLRRMSPS